jgi:hypothetical protein
MIDINVNAAISIQMNQSPLFCEIVTNTTDFYILAYVYFFCIDKLTPALSPGISPLSFHSYCQMPI